MATIFSKIIAGEIPCYKVGEDEKNFAFLDISPVNKGHVLVVPKTENDYIFNLSEEDFISLNLLHAAWQKQWRKPLNASVSV